MKKSSGCFPVIRPAVLAIAAVFASGSGFAQTSQNAVFDASQATQLPEVKVVETAETELKQAPGVSIITAEDIEKRPPVNDLSDIIRTMPGVSLTGNSPSGQRGNNRQINLRGMGPENTLILIDGKPVTSRNSVRYGWRGERDSRGDSNWVPAELVEQIEVIRGPAAARYGNGAAGGVVNIVTKPATEETTGQVTYYTNQPTHKEEGATNRVNFSLQGPLGQDLTYRVFGNYNKTEADDKNINSGHQAPGFQNSVVAGREGVINKDVGGRLSWRGMAGHVWDLDLGYSRQGNIYAGDNQNNLASNNTTYLSNVSPLYGEETNIMTRRTAGLNHRGTFDSATTKSYIQYSQTTNSRINEGLTGGVEGAFSDRSFVTSRLKELTLHSEVSKRLGTALDQTMTYGVEWAGQTLNDPNSVKQAVTGTTLPGVASSGRSADSSARITSFFVEDNIKFARGLTLTPGVRLDSHSETGANWSPSLNLSQALDPAWTVKAGIARAYKAPNLYQSNPNYLLLSSGSGCYIRNGSNGCYLLGNADINPETSVNKELGISYRKDDYAASMTWFRNDYRNRIQAGTTPLATTSNGWYVFQWVNVPEAVISGLEGNLLIPLRRNLTWNTNYTYMIENKNKQTGDYLSVTPDYTVNSTLDWLVDARWSALAGVTWYGTQRAMKYDYRGKPVSGSATNAVSPYAIVNLSGTYRITKDLRFTAGINNLFDKRLYREGNAIVPVTTGVVTTGAGARTYNESGRSFFMSVSQAF